MKITRRKFLAATGYMGAAVGGPWAMSAPSRARPKVAAIVTIYTHNSHADVLVSRILQSHTLDGQGTWPREPWPALELASLYVDQPAPKEKTRALTEKHSFRLSPSIADALTLGTGRLAVDGVLLIGEHGNYELSATGQIMYPRRRFFEETAAVFRQSGRSVPVFQDKHLSWNWEDARWTWEVARELKIPFMAGSSVPGTWRHPPLDVRRGARLQEAVALSYGPLEAYAFHGLEALQCLVERRHGGETGVASVQFAQGPAVWDALRGGRFNRQVLEAALSHIKRRDRLTKPLEEILPKVTGCFIEYRDGFRATMLHDEGALLGEWVVAWREKGATSVPATVFWTQEERPLGHFAFLLQGIERMIHTRKPTWPAERTLLTTGILAAWFQSRQQSGARLATPHLAITYRSKWNWAQPPAPPPGRPFTVQ